MTQGIGGHQSAASRSEDWITPWHIIQALGPFDLDPCSSRTQPWRCAATNWTLEDSGLMKEWFGRVWLNPPYGRETAVWMEKLAAHGTGTALIFARTETDMFVKFAWKSATAMLFLYGRLYFHYPDGRRAEANSGAPSVLIAYGAADAGKLRSCGLAGAYVEGWVSHG